MWSIIGTGGSEAQAAASIFDDCPEIIVETFGETARKACAVAWCESKFDPSATGALGERGYFQIHPGWGWRSSYDPAINVAFAFELSRGGYYWNDWRGCA